MKHTALGLVALSLAAAVLIGGCVTDVATLTSSPSATPVEQDYTTYFGTRIAAQYGTAVVSPLAQITNNTYTGSYRITSNGSSYTATWTIEIASSQGAAKERYNQLVLERIDDGYDVRSMSSLIGPTLFGDAKADWYGYKLNSLESASVYQALYGYNSDLNVWFVATMTGDALSTDIG